tara:strand:+ start:430 stop:1797 length:1368 start_codon:yes stop_codon:yes gene_type:complete
LANETTLYGNIKGFEGGTYENSPVEVLIVKDFITYKKEILKKGLTDDKGNFRLTFHNTDTHIAILKLGKVERTLFIEPGKSYYIPVKASLKKLQASKGFFAKDSRKADIKNSIEGELNYLIDTLDKTCAYFLSSNPLNRKNYTFIKSFTDSIENIYRTVNKPYFHKYLKFKIAELQMFVMRKYRDEFVTRHFKQSNNYAANVQSMHVLNSFFKGNIKHNILSDDNSPFHRAMLQTNLHKMLLEVSPSTSDNRELNELILMKGIVEIADVYYYRKSILSNALDKIIATTSYPIHKEIAKNIKAQINHLEIGTKAPGISIKNETRNFDIEKHKGKYLYISFFRGWDVYFQKELEIINYLKERYKDDLDVVCISTDIDIKTYNDFIAQQDESDFIYHYNFDPQILIDYRIPDFRMQETHQWQKPASHVLVGPKGTIVYNHAKSPSKGFEYDFRLLIGK